MGLQDVISKVRDRGRWTATELERAVRASKFFSEDRVRHIISMCWAFMKRGR